MDTATALSQLQSWLGHKVAAAFSGALLIDTPGGSSGPWLELLTHFKVTPESDEAKARGVKATGMTRGASPDELYALTLAIARSAKKKLKAIPYPDDDQLERRYDKLQREIDEIPEQTLAAYRKRVMPKKGGMFAQAKEAALKKQGAPATSTGGDAYVLCCRGCGAPRLFTRDLTCPYCGGDFTS